MDQKFVYVNPNREKQVCKDLGSLILALRRFHVNINTYGKITQVCEDAYNQLIENLTREGWTINLFMTRTGKLSVKVKAPGRGGGQ